MVSRRSKPSRPPPPAQTLILDNGAFTLKAGVITSSSSSPDSDSDMPSPRVIPNTLARDRHKKTYIASQVSKVRDYSELAFRRPVEKGFVVNWEVQKEIWDWEILGEAGLGVVPGETTLLLGEALGGLPALQTHCDQIVFEEYGFARYFRSSTPTWTAYTDIQPLFTPPRPSAATLPSEILFVIDSGYSHTHIIPLLNGRPLHSATRRLDIGGKFLTNHLARLLSIRHYDMRNDTAIVNEIKERACFVSSDFNADLEACWRGPQGARNLEFAKGSRGIAKDYVLPDFHARMHGEVRDYDPGNHIGARARVSAAEDIITLRNERFSVPEVLFSPSDVGMRTLGIADLLVQSLEALPVGLWPGLLLNIVVIGGNALFEGFTERLWKEVVERVPSECVVRVARGANPVTAGWKGGMGLARHGDFEKVVVTKEEYEENGAGWVARKFAAGLNVV